MPPKELTRWIGVGILGSPLYGALTFWSSLTPQPDPETRMDDWARFVTTDHYLWTHVLGSGLGLILAIFGTFALGVWLAPSRAGRMGLVAMILAVFGSAVFLMLQGVSAFAAPWEGQAHLAGVEGLSDLPPGPEVTVMGALTLLMVVLTLAGNVLLGIAVWRSGVLPRGAGALWIVAHLLMYVLGLVYATAVGSQSTPPTVPLGALLLVVGGGWMAWSVLRGPLVLGSTAPA